MLVSEHLAEFVNGFDCSLLPEDVAHRLKIVLLDAFGDILAGSSAAGVDAVSRLIQDWGGTPEATALVFGSKVPAPSAALVNSMMLHARELDDDHEEASIHAFSAVLPAALAAAEKVGLGGREFFSALVAGSEISCRLGLSVRILRGWHLSAVCGTFGAAAAAGRILGLDRSGLIDAIGLAYSRAAGNLQAGREGVVAKRMQPAFAAQAGVTSAELASRGVSGPRQVFDGQYGFFRLYDSDHYDESEIRRRLDGSLYDRGALLDGLGRSFEVAKLIIKPYGSCRFTHGPLEATLNLVQAHNLAPDEIESVHVLACPRAVRDYGKPFAPHASKTPEVAAQFSIPYVVAAAVVHRSGYVDAFEKRAVLDPRIKEVAAKVTVSVHPEAALKVPVEVKMKTIHGHQYAERINALKASLERPLSYPEVMDKFWANAKYAVKTIETDRLNELVDLTLNIERVQHVREIIDLMS